MCSRSSTRGLSVSTRAVLSIIVSTFEHLFTSRAIMRGERRGPGEKLRFQKKRPTKFHHVRTNECPNRLSLLRELCTLPVPAVD